MRRYLAYIAFVFFGLGIAAQAQGPDEKYVFIYAQIQEADGLLAKEQLLEAGARYREAHAALKQLEEVHPNWNPKVVAYRLSYIQGKLTTLAEKTRPAVANTNTNAPAAPGSPAPAVPAPQPPGVPPTEMISTNQLAQMQAMQEQIAQLSQQNVRLETKLKEAWSVQPAADPRELAKAQQAVMDLQKERDLLKASLEEAKTKKPVEMPDTAAKANLDLAAIEQERKILADVKEQLARQIELVGTLQKENETLKGQLAAMTRSTPNADVMTELQAAKTTIAALQATNTALATDRAMLEARFAELSQDLVPRASVQEVLRERDELRKRLASGGRESSRRSRGKESEQTRAALARLEALEAKPVPYSREELALFKQPDVKMTVTDAAPVRKKTRELPPGAGPLMADAQRDMDAGRFNEAERKFSEILRQDDKNVMVLGYLASVQMDQNRLSQAEESLTRALGVERDDPAALYLMGRLRLLQEKFDEALDSLSLSAKSAPDDPRTQYWLGKVLIHKGQRAAAETALRKAVQLRPGWGEAHYSLAVVYATQQPPFKELAQWHYQKALTGGYPRNVDFEKLIEEKRASSQ